MIFYSHHKNLFISNKAEEQTHNQLSDLDESASRKSDDVRSIKACVSAKRLLASQRRQHESPFGSEKRTAFLHHRLSHVSVGTPVHLHRRVTESKDQFVDALRGGTFETVNKIRKSQKVISKSKRGTSIDNFKFVSPKSRQEQALFRDASKQTASTLHKRQLSQSIL